MKWASAAVAALFALQATAVASPLPTWRAAETWLPSPATLEGGGWFPAAPSRWLGPAGIALEPLSKAPDEVGARATETRRDPPHLRRSDRAAGAAGWLFPLSPVPLWLASAPDDDRPAADPEPATATLAQPNTPGTGEGERSALIDISMKPIPGPADPARPRLQPAVYVRALAAPSAERLLGAGGAPNIFGSVALAAGHTPEDAKWRRVADYVPSPGAGPWSALLAHARGQSLREQLVTVNAWVNHAITYATDAANYGVADYWGTARESLTRGRGDCKDYAIAKMELLRALGVPSEDLYLVLVKDLVRRQDHAVLAVRVDGQFVVLDSGADDVMPSEDVRDYRPILTFSGGRTWIHGFRRAQDTMIASAAASAAGAFAWQ